MYLEQSISFKLQNIIDITENIFHHTEHAVPVSGLQMTDVELDERVSALEENGGAGTVNGKYDCYHDMLWNF